MPQNATLEKDSLLALALASGTSIGDVAAQAGSTARPFIESSRTPPSAARSPSTATG